MKFSAPWSYMPNKIINLTSQETQIGTVSSSLVTVLVQKNSYNKHHYALKSVRLHICDIKKHEFLAVKAFA
jgi:hypothetical protein